MSPPFASRRPGLTIALVLTAVFGSGLVVGAALERYRAPRVPPGWTVIKGPRTEGGIPFQLTRLGLTPEQEARMREIAGRYRPRADSLMGILLPQVRGIQHGMFQEMACVLTPAQDSAYLAWRKREGLNQAEGEEQLSRVREGTCPRTDSAGGAAR